MRVPIFRELTDAECEELLRQHHVGRLAFVRDGSVDIEPIHYVFTDGWIFGRTGEGTKLESIAHRPWVAFEVDDVHGLFDWRSVVVHGTIYLLADDGAPLDREQYTRALELLRTLVPETMTPDDPTPARTIVFGLHADRISGRVAEVRRVRAPRGARQAP